MPQPSSLNDFYAGTPPGQYEYDVLAIANKLWDWREDFGSAEAAARDIIEYLATKNHPPAA